MFHWFGVVQNTRGDALPNWQVGLVEVGTQTVVPIFADENSTPIASVSGVANRAVADLEGNYDFYVPSGTYTLRFFNSAGEFQREQRFIAMYGTDFTTGLIDDLASTATGKGAALIGTQGSGTVQSALDARPTSATLAAAGGAALVGSNDGAGGSLWTTLAGFVTYLRSSVGSAIIGFINTGTGATARTVQAKLRDTVSVKDFGAVGDGTTNDTPAIQAAIDSLGAKGGAVKIPNDMRCLIDTTLTVRANVSLEGPHKFVGSPGNNTSAPYGSVGGALIVNSAATIIMGGGASITGLLIHRKGMTFPESDESLFAGTAITANGDDVSVRYSLILGFNQAYTSANCQRPLLRSVLMDCKSGVLINNCADIARLIDCHAWPFATIVSGNINGYKRSGVAFAFTGLNDWSKATDCFSYGYFRGFRVADSEHVTLLGCSADNTPPTTNAHANAIGFLVEGAANDTRLIGCQSAAHSASYYVNTTAGRRTRIRECDSWGVQAAGSSIVIVAGDVSVYGGALREGVNGVAVTNATSRVLVDQVRFDNLTGQPILSLVNSANVIIGRNNDYGALSVPNGGLLALPTLPSAAVLPLPMFGDKFLISGTTGIGAAGNGWTGRQITLFFLGALTVAHGTNPGEFRLSGGVNFSVTAGGTLTLLHNGTQWFEIGRSV